MASPVALLAQSRGPVHIKQTVAMGLSSENAHPVSPYCSPAPVLPTTQDTGQSFSTPLPLCRPSVLFYPSPALTQAVLYPWLKVGLLRPCAGSYGHTFSALDPVRWSAAS